jgi:prepilin-type processing-associated H-X9-DG protein
LVELLTLIAIIALLGAILFPVFGQAREKARQSNCLSNHRQVGAAIVLYAQDYDETLLPTWGFAQVNGRWQQELWPRLLLPYCNNPAVFRDPSNAARTGLDAVRGPAAGATVAEPDAGEGVFIGMGRNGCLPDFGLAMACVTAPTESIALCDARLKYPRANPMDDYGYHLVWYLSTLGRERLCQNTQAGTGNYGVPAAWHNGGATVTFFDGHSRWLKEETIRTPPAQYQRDLKQWKLWFALD